MRLVRFAMSVMTGLALSLAAPAVASPAASEFGVVLNQVRQSAGLPPLTPLPALGRAAERHLTDMLSHRFFAHRGSDGSRLGHRLQAAGWCLANGGENLAWGQRSTADVLRGWMASPGHRANLLRQGANGYGLAEARGVWVLVVGGPC